MIQLRCGISPVILAGVVALGCGRERVVEPAGESAAAVEASAGSAVVEPGASAAPASDEAGDAPGAIDESVDHHVDDGSELIGKRAKPWQLSDWDGGEPMALEDLRGRVVVVRFWTLECPFCERSMPALQTLSQEFAGEPVTFIGAFHAKPVGSQPDMTKPVKVAREQWGVTFPLAFDRGWKTLNAWWMDGYHRHATSVTFVVGKNGELVHIHKGPVFFPSSDPDEAAQNRDFLALRAAISAALK